MLRTDLVSHIFKGEVLALRGWGSCRPTTGQRLRRETTAQNQAGAPTRWAVLSTCLNSGSKRADGDVFSTFFGWHAGRVDCFRHLHLCSDAVALDDRLANAGLRGADPDRLFRRRAGAGEPAEARRFRPW